MSEEPDLSDVVVDYCPVHESLFWSDNRIECHAFYANAVSVSYISRPPWNLPCKWWHGTLTDLKPHGR